MMTAYREESVGFKTVKIFKDQVLGIGAYGKVCRAQCDLLPCAAKIMHETLFDPSLNEKARPNHEHRLPFSRFKRECAFLSVIKHPNIVQYLGMYRDPESHLPVLLMEHMDWSLTQFLEKLAKPNPFHVHVDICHDIVLALYFLHSNGVIHRDLSGNNVLMISNIRTKVTDFGMARLVDPKRLSMITHTMCPGTDVYMPPEAVDDPPVYTEKIDCFSFGVVMIQLLTRQFPSPSPRKKKVNIDHPGIPEGVAVEVPIPEIERRHEHIKKIDSSHPLLSIALKCLRNKSEDRPSSEELCESLSALKSSQKYKDSKKAKGQMQSDGKCGSSSAEAKKKVHVEELVIKEKERQLQQTKQELEASHVTIDSLNKQIEELELLLEQQRKKRRRNLNFSWKGTKKAPCDMYRGADAVVDGSMAYFRPAGSLLVYGFDLTRGKWLKLPAYSNEKCSLVIAGDLLTTVGGAHKGRMTNQLLSLVGEDVEKEWKEYFPPMPTRRSRVSVVYAPRAVVVAGGVKDGNIVCNTVEVLNVDTHTWTMAASLPEPLYRSSMAICDDSIYLLGGFDRKHLAVRSVLVSPIRLILESNSTDMTKDYKSSIAWSKTTDLSVTQSTCVTVQGQLLAIGGMEIDRAHYRSADIRSYDPIEKRWEVIGRMSTPRRRCYAAALFDDHLMVVGGMADNGLSGMDAFEIATISVSY